MVSGICGKLCLPLAFNGTLLLSAPPSALSEMEVIFLSIESVGMLSDQFWKIGVFNDIRPYLRAQLTPMIRLNLLLTMKNLHGLV